MKVVHFSPIYNNGWGYQENLLPEYFQLLGHDVCLISIDKVPNLFEGNNVLKDKCIINGVEIRRISTFFFLSYTFFATKGLYKNLKELKPDLLFHHDICLSSLLVCVVYKLFNPACKLFVDNHADYINQSKSQIWFFFYYKTILMLLSKISSPFVEMFYGVSNGRCDFLRDVFKINQKKIKILPIGADTNAIDKIKISKIDLRIKHFIPIDSFIVVSGGKNGIDKGTDLLIQAVDQLNSVSKNIILVLFGSVKDNTTQELINNSESVISIDWCDRTKTIELLKLADVAIWPIHHTTLIEDSIACNTPIVVRKTRTTEHLIDENGIFIENGTINEIKIAISQIMQLEPLQLIKHCEKMKDKIDYKKIVDTIITDINSGIL